MDTIEAFGSIATKLALSYPAVPLNLQQHTSSLLCGSNHTSTIVLPTITTYKHSTAFK